jgi:hypothetical protein
VLALLLILPLSPIQHDRCDLIDTNHFYDDEGRHVFDQLIFLDWNGDDSRYDVRAWRLIKSPDQVPYRDWSRGGYAVTWQDGEVVRTVRAEAVRETWTQYDPETLARATLPVEQRRGLR